jgi:hypothetical protein
MHSFNSSGDPGGFVRIGWMARLLELMAGVRLGGGATLGMIRRIYTNGRPMPGYLPPSLMGFSLGHFEGAELVIETTNYAPGILVSRGVFQYGDMSAVERYRLVDDDRGLEGDEKRIQ